MQMVVCVRAACRDACTSHWYVAHFLSCGLPTHADAWSLCSRGNRASEPPGSLPPELGILSLGWVLVERRIQYHPVHGNVLIHGECMSRLAAMVTIEMRTGMEGTQGAGTQGAGIQITHAPLHVLYSRRLGRALLSLFAVHLANVCGGNTIH
jgi:hypothetical protein